MNVPSLQATLRTSLLLAALLGASGCAVLQNESQAKRLAQLREPHTAFRSQPGWRKLTYRNADLLAQANAQNSSVEISLREQRGLLLVDGGIAMDFPVATGRNSHPTPKGHYKILHKQQDYASNLYGKIVSETGEVLVADADTRTDAIPPGAAFVGSRMPYWMRMTPTGVGMHVGYVPGRPASHGCIRLKPDVAKELFRILSLGSPVVVDSFAPSLGGPVGLDSVVVGEVAVPRPSSKPRPKPSPTPAASPVPAPATAPSSAPPRPSADTPAAAPAPQTEPTPGLTPRSSLP
jgi:hypothetical protein